MKLKKRLLLQELDPYLHQILVVVVSCNVPLVDEVLGMLHGLVFQVEWKEVLSIEWNKEFSESRALRKGVSRFSPRWNDPLSTPENLANSSKLWIKTKLCLYSIRINRVIIIDKKVVLEIL
jgi:hypothetical protein